MSLEMSLLRCTRKRHLLRSSQQWSLPFSLKEKGTFLYKEDTQMKRMWSKNELKNIADVQAKEVKKDFTTLVDKDGHDRFIEGDMVLNESLANSVEDSYGKWSLSGSHLMLVFAGKAKDGAVLTGLTLCNSKDLPKWIYDKIYPIVGSTGPIEYNSFQFNSSNFSTINVTINFQKSGLQTLSFIVAQTLTISTDRYFRISFDLLIDNE